MIIKLIPLKTPILRENVLGKLLNFIKKSKIRIEDGDVLVISSKIVALAENRIIELKKIKPSKKAKKIAKKFKISEELAEIILKEADKILGGVKGAVLTLKNKILVANAGVDQSNAPKGKAILWPKNPDKSAENIKKLIKKEFKKEIGVIIADSCCQPARLGTTAQAIGLSGFLGILDERGKPDLFGKKMWLTTRNLADQLATAANLVMGERNEKIPAVIIRGVKIKKTYQKNLSRQLLINPKQDLFKDVLKI